MKKDIANAGDLKFLLTEFYNVAAQDPELEQHFKDVDMRAHVTKQIAFWERALFGRPSYAGDSIAAHKRLSDKTPVTSDHFQKWVELLRRTVEEHFEGPNANNVKFRAEIIASGINQGISGT